MKLPPIATTLVIASLAASAHAAQEFASFALGGATRSEGWYDLNNANYAGYGTHGTSTAAWPSPIASSFGSGAATWDKIAGTSGYLGSAATNGIYTPGTPLGSFIIADTSPLAGLETIVFQVDLQIASGSFVAPVLSYNGGNQNLVAEFSATIYEEALSGGMGSSTRTVYAYQWDLTTAGVVSDFILSWSAPAAHTITYGAQLQQSDAFTGSVIPEPSAYAALAGLAALGLVAAHRRRA